MDPDASRVHAVDAAETGYQRLAERARSFFDRFAADPGLEGDGLTEADDRGFVPLSHGFHSSRDADCARIGADDARVDTALRASVNVETRLLWDRMATCARCH